MAVLPFTPGVSVVAYLRDSGHEDQDLSIDQQEAQLRAFCEENHLVLAHIYKDAAAPGSSTAGRDQFLEMIHVFRDPACQLAGVLVWKFNRFARDIDDAQFYKADLRRRGYTIHSLTDNIPDGLDGRFFEAAVDWMSARYLEDLKTDVKRGQHHLISTYGGIGGIPPRGFMRQAVTLPDHRDGAAHIVHKWVPDPDLLEQIRTAWRMRAEGATYPQIEAACHLYRSSQGYERFFRNRLYIGEMEFGDQVIPDYCDPIIDRNLWDAVLKIQQRHATRTRKSEDHPRRAQSTFLLSGLVFCARCGSAMNNQVVQFRSTAKYRYQYYACNGVARHTCDAPKIPRAFLENQVIETLAEIATDPVFVENRRLQLLEQRKNSQATLRAEKTRLNRTLRTTRDRIRNLTDLVSDGGSAVKSIVVKLQELESEETALLAQIANLVRPPAPIPTAAQLTQLLRSLRDVLAGGDPAQLSTILHGLIARVTVELDSTTKTVRGLLEYYDPLNAYRASSDALYDPALYGLDQCPGRGSFVTHKIYLNFSLPGIR